MIGIWSISHEQIRLCLWPPRRRFDAAIASEEANANTTDAPTAPAGKITESALKRRFHCAMRSPNDRLGDLVTSSCWLQNVRSSQRLGKILLAQRSTSGAPNYCAMVRGIPVLELKRCCTVAIFPGRVDWHRNTSGKGVEVRKFSVRARTAVSYFRKIGGFIPTGGRPPWSRS
jgi:hypothetical protein